MSLRKIRAPQRRFPSASSVNYDENFMRIADAIHAIFAKNSRTLLYEELYRLAYHLTLSRMHERLYYDVQKEVSSILDTIAETKIVPAFMDISNANDNNADSGASFLRTMNKTWEDYTLAMESTAKILGYLDSKIESYKLPHIHDMSNDLFRDKIIRSEKYPIRTHLVNAMLNQIHRERQGETIDRSVMKASVSMLSQMTDAATEESVYIVDFENKYIETSTMFYKLESEALTASYDAPEFLKKVERRLDEEFERSTHYLMPSTEPRVRNVVENQLIANNLTSIMEMPKSGLINMLSDDKHTDLSRMYKLFSCVPAGLHAMRQAISDYFLGLGMEINCHIGTDMTAKNTGEKDPNAASSAIQWVNDVLALQAKFDKILEKAVYKDKTFQMSLNEVFEQFINENKRCSEFISLYIDEKLKKGLKGHSDAEIDDIMDKMVVLFRFLRDKDVFERYYKQHLAKRLLFNRSVSDDAERGMLVKLKRECGYQFTSKMEGMFNDIRLSAEMNSQFRDFTENAVSLKPGFDMSVTVLTSTFWPMNTVTQTCILPPQSGHGCRAFEAFYFGRHSGRQLTWQLQMGTADLRAQFKNGKHILNVSSYAMIVLLAFNDVEDDTWFTFQDIQERTRIPELDLKRTLFSLACGKHKVLRKEPKDKDMQSDNKFSVNTSFTSNMARIKIQAVSSKVETDTERKQTQTKVDEERKHQIEATIVRTMKNRKAMEHNMLVAEVTRQLSARFLPNPVMIKKRIEALIDREYLERSPHDRRSYQYVA